MPEPADILYQVEGAIATITLNRVNQANAINTVFAQLLLKYCKQAAEDDNVLIVIINANGKNFCAGAELSNEVLTINIEDFINDVCKPIVLLISEMNKPVISVVNGSAAGIGAAFALAADLCVMADDAHFYLAFSDISLVPDGGMSWMLTQQLGKKRAYQLLIEGARISATEALTLGLCNKVFSASQLQTDTLTWAIRLSERAPLSLSLTKHAVNTASQGSGLNQSISTEAKLQRLCQLSEDFQEALAAFKEKRSPQYKGC
ncbi:enoyl-CoA hydratase/isomerase family protein [Neptunomonas japonica]|uniref:2-(1,2-epoxy-1,2-dihydrophenyl)acetyl-CoA isomerase n=1 Tax=Neptunomonas japonica JAMM 1380 TaxID=1441457 RepID=A0A7R6PVQ8_9GAMM|nr:enoyl-CoA hydratase-related protein [Neptunomonas japonica]BBB30478.1 2-(1,2-epoxy-1,2-dihydrophenyl)acetyl-CoA isomerase [Neptunomonas japonica JAMM 1380]